MIEARGLTKRYGETVAVDSLSFTVEPGKITGFLGPNGAGKTTTMRLILGLDRPSAGSVTVNGKPFGQAAYPMREVGALLDAKAVHGGRSAHSVRTLQASALAAAVGTAGGTVREEGNGLMTVLGLDVRQVGDLAFDNGVRLHELAPAQASLEQAFMELTANSVQFHAGVPGEPGLQPATAREVA